MVLESSSNGITNIFGGSSSLLGKSDRSPACGSEILSVKLTKFDCGSSRMKKSEYLYLNPVLDDCCLDLFGILMAEVLRSTFNDLVSPRLEFF